jgi:hypothetical protein
VLVIDLDGNRRGGIAMKPEELLDYVKKWAERVNNVANIRLMGVGFAIPIPGEATEGAKSFVDGQLTQLAWNFCRCSIGSKEYYVLFPL